MNQENNIHNSGQRDIITERKKRIFSLRTLFLLILSISLLALLLSRIDLGKTINTFKNARIVLIPLAVLLYATSNFSKTLRLKVLLHKYKIDFLTLYTVVSYHNFFNQILPARTGELTLIYYLNKMGKVDSSKGLHSLLVAHIFDLIVVSIFFVVALIIFYGRGLSEILLVLGIIMGIFSVILLFNLSKLMIVCKTIYRKITRLFRIEQKSLIVKIDNKLEEVISDFSEFDTKKYIPMLALTSIMVWFALYFFSYVNIHVFGINVQFLQTIIGSTGAVLTNVLPVNSFGSFGTLEAGWTGGFVFMGMSAQEAITTGFGNHIINFFSSASLAIIFTIFYRVRIYLRDKKSPPA